MPAHIERCAGAGELVFWLTKHVTILSRTVREVNHPCRARYCAGTKGRGSSLLIVKSARSNFLSRRVDREYLVGIRAVGELKGLKASEIFVWLPTPKATARASPIMTQSKPETSVRLIQPTRNPKRKRGSPARGQRSERFSIRLSTVRGQPRARIAKSSSSRPHNLSIQDLAPLGAPQSPSLTA
jgi:hypothetical protein